ncbi:MAG: 2-hydroxyacyl-CoA dehydratase [bacterium]|nr:2-hydroxyacyl-CoA dehydratase [bacterium]
MGNSRTERIGITTTLPIEAIFAAGAKPIDLNNVFISGESPGEAVFAAEKYGFPSTSCSWIKGIFTTVKEYGINRVIGVTGGDCSNTLALMETLAAEGVEVIPFEYPFDGDEIKLKNEMGLLCSRLGISPTDANSEYEKLYGVRADLAEIDRLTRETGQVTGAENFGILVAASDMGGDRVEFEKRVKNLLATARRRPKRNEGIRLGLVGVPPIFSDGLFATLVEMDADIVFNEVPRQFAMIRGAPDILSAYSRYTYPYGIKRRLEDVTAEAKRRELDGIIHYVQSFCYRAIEDILLRKGVNLPVLTLEGDKPAPLSAQIRLRIEVFVEMIRNNAG